MEDDEPGSTGAAAIQAVAMLRAVIDGRTYDSVAADFGITRTAVERRVKAVAIRLCREVGIEGMNDGATAFVRRLRERRDAILHALERFEPAAGHAPKGDRVVSADEIARAVLRIRGRSAQPARDMALFYTLFVTGARPLEIVGCRSATICTPMDRCVANLRCRPPPPSPAGQGRSTSRAGSWMTRWMRTWRSGWCEAMAWPTPPAIAAWSQPAPCY